MDNQVQKQTGRKTVLVVDDDIDVVEQLNLILDAAGYQVQTADSQAAAEEWLAAHQPDVAIVDLMMENSDSGFVLAYHIKRKFAQVPVIILTSVTSETGVDFDLNTPGERSWIKADSFLDKPVRSEQILGEVRRLLKE